MKQILAVLLLSLSLVHGAETRPSEASIKELLEVTQARKLIDGMMPQLEGMMKQAMREGRAGRDLSDTDEKAMEKVQAVVIDSIRSEMSWDQWEPIYLKIYRDSFSQEEINGLLTFYKSPAGVALIKKMPVVMQSTMTEVQKRIKPMTERMRKKMDEALDEIAAEKAAKRKKSSTETNPAKPGESKL